MTKREKQKTSIEAGSKSADTQEVQTAQTIDVKASVQSEADGSTDPSKQGNSDENQIVQTETQKIELIGKTKKKKWKILLLVILLLVVALAIYRIASSSKPQAPEKTPPVNVKVTTAQLESLESTSPLTGRLEPVDQVSVIPLTSGKIVKLNVKVGDPVAAGAVLFEIDQTPFTATFTQALDAFNTAQANADRTALLYSEGAVSKQQNEQAQSSLVTAQSALANAQESLDHCTVTAPISGYVTALDVSVGSMASQSSPSLTIANTSQLEIKTNVSEYLISKIAVGDPVEIYIRSLSDDPFKGSIKSISPAPAQGSLTYPITVGINSSDSKIKAGMFAEINIVSDEKVKVLCVPSDSVLIKNGESLVVVLENGLPTFKKVTTGLDNGELVEIKEGINPGDTVITQGQHYVKEGETVNVVK